MSVIVEITIKLLGGVVVRWTGEEVVEEAVGGDDTLAGFHIVTQPVTVLPGRGLLRVCNELYKHKDKYHCKQQHRHQNKFKYSYHSNSSL